MKIVRKKHVIEAAARSCKSLSSCENFFRFEHSDSWLGWENWLTVDIVRRLDHPDVVRFGAYRGRLRSDITIVGRKSLAVEVKVSFVDRKEIVRWSNKHTVRKLPARALKDLAKLKMASSTARLFLFAAALEDASDSLRYRKILRQHLKSDLHGWRSSWHECGSIMLLALYQEV